MEEVSRFKVKDALSSWGDKTGLAFSAMAGAEGGVLAPVAFTADAAAVAIRREDLRPFPERLATYILSRSSEGWIEGSEIDYRKARKVVREGALSRGCRMFEGQGSHLDDWFGKSKEKKRKRGLVGGPSGQGAEGPGAFVKFIAENRYYSISKESTFVLCLSLHLDLEESRDFIYDCLYRDWFNYRSRTDAIRLFTIAQQGLLGERSYPFYEEVKAETEGSEREPIESLFGKPPRTTEEILRPGLMRLVGADYHGDVNRAKRELIAHIKLNAPNFTEKSRTVLLRYNEYLTGDVGQGAAVNFKPLASLYKESFPERERKGKKHSLPASDYLLDDCKDSLMYTRDRLLWGAKMRSVWNKTAEGKKWYDILDAEEMLTERHDLGKMLCKDGRLGKDMTMPKRGNIIALYFFHFCYSNAERLEVAGKEPHPALFNEFFDGLNDLLDDCGMMPLHPLRPFDKMFLISVANCSNDAALEPYHPEQPIPVRFLNTMLVDYYSTEDE